MSHFWSPQAHKAANEAARRQRAYRPSFQLDLANGYIIIRRALMASHQTNIDFATWMKHALPEFYYNSKALQDRGRWEAHWTDDELALHAWQKLAEIWDANPRDEATRQALIEIVGSSEEDPLSRAEAWREERRERYHS